MTTNEINEELLAQFVIAAHSDVERVRALLAEHPALLNERYAKYDETALEAASHMGNRAIAEYLLAAGAPLTICAAAMLGRRDAVETFLRGDPELALSSGAHGIPLMFHAALGGNVALAELLLEYGGGEQIAGALHGAVWYSRLEMAEWLLQHGAELGRPNFQGKTPLEAAQERGDTAMVALLERYATPQRA
ncbi:MAG: ankyrin repeat domain-containing protein [Chloroflexales bacterium]|nr:ankyrin repeat domain-containing protein [Chloroflexales bacterium]